MLSISYDQYGGAPRELPPIYVGWNFMLLLWQESITEKEWKQLNTL